MAVGVSTVNTANAWLNVLRGTTFTGKTNMYVKLHTADPGASGATAAAVGSTTRVLITWAAASGGSIAMNGTAPVWTNGGTTETITHLSFWDDPSAGNFMGSCALTASQAWVNTNTLTLSTQTWSITPLAA